MTNDEFAAWLRVEFDSISAAEKALEIDRDTLKSMMSGVRRKSGLAIRPIDAARADRSRPHPRAAKINFAIFSHHLLTMRCSLSIFKSWR